MPICLFDNHNGGKIISFIDTCNRYNRNKKLIVFRSSLIDLLFKRYKIYAYCISRSDIWIFSDHPEIRPAFERWHFGLGDERWLSPYC